MKEISNLIKKILFFFERRAALANCKYLGATDRIKLCFSRNPDSSSILYPLINTIEDHTLEINFADYMFQMPYPKDKKAQATVRSHFSQVMAETFIAPLFFHGPIQVAKGDIVFDLGANLGSTTALFSRLIGVSGKVFSFEPSIYPVLQKNIERNKIKNVELIEAAIGSSCGIAQMSIGESGMDSTLCSKLSWHKEFRMVPLTTLDQFVQDHGVDRVNFIKMDIEGAEESAILGAQKLIARDRPKWSISSYHTDFSGEKQHDKLLKLLQGLDYTVIDIPGFHIYAY